jgi:hypothetical protein
MARLTAEDFVSPATPLLRTKEVEIEGRGSVLVRGFSKAAEREMRSAALRPDGEIDSDRLELLMFQKGLADPELTVEQVEQAFAEWDAAAINAILAAIMELNGLAPNAVREQVATFREES